jgi:hypothetical protein
MTGDLFVEGEDITYLSIHLLPLRFKVHARAPHCPDVVTLKVIYVLLGSMPASS